MPKETYNYVIVGAGLAGASAIQGIREIDKNRPILLIGNENHLPYDRPPLTKQLWSGKKKVEEIFVKTQKFYHDNGVKILLGKTVTSLDTAAKTIMDEKGSPYHYEKLLISTGGAPRYLAIPGGDLDGIYYYRYLDDYLRMKNETIYLTERRSAIVIGGGFIGSEIAAALNMNKLDVTMIFPSGYLCNRVFPSYLGEAMNRYYADRGITVMAGERPVLIERRQNRFCVRTQSGKEAQAELVVAGIGIEAETALAKSGGIKTGNGVIVDEYLQTSNPDVFAAGDNAFFPYKALGQEVRIEHWDNAVNQGKWAGRNMAGAHEPFTYMPYFFSDLFKFGYEAVGEVSSKLETFADWQKENDTGVIYYMKEGVVKGAMMCNIWEKVDSARQLILKRGKIAPEGLKDLIR